MKDAEKTKAQLINEAAYASKVESKKMKGSPPIFYLLSFIFYLLLVLLLPRWVSAQVRIKDIARIQGLQDTPLIGYGLVIGLDGTGDRRGSVFTVQSVGNMLMRFGITVPQDKIRLRNAAAVMVTGEIPPLVRKGGRIDVVVSSLGDARSLEGGTLLLTPLLGKDGTVYAYAQGSVSIGGFNIEAQGGERIRRNYTVVGRVPNGAIVEQELPLSFGADGRLAILLRRPDFTSAVRLAEAVNGAFGGQTPSVGGQTPSVQGPIAFAKDAGTVLIEVPSDWKATDRLAKFIASVETLEMEPDGVARVVINERTGTIVVGEHVRLSTAAVSHENLTIQIQATPVISQPLPFSRGETVVVPETEVTVTENESAEMSVIPPTANIGDLAKALNALGVTPRDIIAIFQALKEAGALQAELVIM